MGGKIISYSIPRDLDLNCMHTYVYTIATNQLYVTIECSLWFENLQVMHGMLNLALLMVTSPQR